MKKKFKLLKHITLVSLTDDDACYEAVKWAIRHFGRTGVKTNGDLQYLLPKLKTSWIEWLVEHNYIEPEMESLKPCPFCGASWVYTMETNTYWKDGQYLIKVLCGNCKATTQGGFISKQQAVEAWNCRS